MATTVTTTVRVIYGILDDTANSWTNAFAALAAGAPDLDVLVLNITDDANGCLTF